MEAFQWSLCVVCRNRGMSCVTCGNVGYLVGELPVAAKKASRKTSKTSKSNKAETTAVTSQYVPEANDVVHEGDSNPPRKTGWRWAHGSKAYGILSIEGVHYFARKSGIAGVYNLTKIEVNEVTYHVDVAGDRGCSCLSREDGGCKHLKALLALKSSGQL